MGKGWGISEVEEKHRQGIDISLLALLTGDTSLYRPFRSVTVL